MKLYCGQRRDDGSVRVVVRYAPLAGGRFAADRADVPARDLAPSGGSFDWGIESPAALSLSHAILADCVGADGADDLCAEFEWSVLRGLPDDTWELTDGDVRAFLELVPGLRLARAVETRTWLAHAPAGAAAFNPFDSSTWCDPAGYASR